MKVLLVVYDNGSYIHDFPMGLAYIAGTLREKGIYVEIYSQDYHHYPDEHLTRYLDSNKFDVLGLSIIGGYYQYRKLLSLSKAINNSKNRPFYIIGGHGPAPEPEYFLKKTQADAVVIGEGEITIINLLDAITKRQSLNNVKGIAFRDGQDVFINERQPLIEDIDTIPFPAYDLFPIEYYRLLRFPHCRQHDYSMRVLSGRGCPFTCNFCYRLDKGFRPRRSDAIIDEIELLKKDYRISYIAFGDELLMSSVKRIEDLCSSFIKHKLRVNWSCNGRLNYAKKEVLKLMKDAGCVFINYGIEAMDDRILKNMSKVLTTEMITKGIEATLEAGISPGYNIIFGNIGENRETLMKGVDFLLKYDDGAQFRTIRPVTPYPGSPLYYYAIEKGLLKNCEDFYENKHTNSDLLTINFTELSDEEFYSALFDANKILIENYFARKEKEALSSAENLYINRDASFRGFRQT